MNLVPATRGEHWRSDTIPADSSPEKRVAGRPWNPEDAPSRPPSPTTYVPTTYVRGDGICKGRVSQPKLRAGKMASWEEAGEVHEVRCWTR